MQLNPKLLICVSLYEQIPTSFNALICRCSWLFMDFSWSNSSFIRAIDLAVSSCILLNSRRNSRSFSASHNSLSLATDLRTWKKFVDIHWSWNKQTNKKGFSWFRKWLFISNCWHNPLTESCHPFYIPVISNTIEGNHNNMSGAHNNNCNYNRCS